MCRIWALTAPRRLDGEAAPSKPQAVSSAGANSYVYDCNGNVLTRTVGGSTTWFAHDTENRLTATSGAVTSSVFYDGDGNRVRATVGGVTTTYLGHYYEWTGTGTVLLTNS